MEFEATARVLLRMPRLEAWRRMQDMTLSKYYVPGLLDCRVTTEGPPGVGASRKVYLKHMAMEETVIEWTDGTGFLLRLHDGDGPPLVFSQATCRYRLQDAAHDCCTFEHTLSYSMKWGPFGKLLARLAMHRVVQRSAKRVAENLKVYYETGRPTNPAWRAT